MPGSNPDRDRARTHSRQKPHCSPRPSVDNALSVHSSRHACLVHSVETHRLPRGILVAVQPIRLMRSCGAMFERRNLGSLAAPGDSATPCALLCRRVRPTATRPRPAKKKRRACLPCAISTAAQGRRVRARWPRCPRAARRVSNPLRPVKRSLDARRGRRRITSHRRHRTRAGHRGGFVNAQTAQLRADQAPLSMGITSWCRRGNSRPSVGAGQLTLIVPTRSSGRAADCHRTRRSGEGAFDDLARVPHRSSTV